jgi:predicted amidophosphoribosyltransferase
MERGFNQSELLAEKVASRMDMRCEDVLVRHRETAVQALLDRRERIKNVMGAFSLKGDSSRFTSLPEKVFLLDDVITSGATFLECARVLQKTGVKEIYGIMLAHGL